MRNKYGKLYFDLTNIDFTIETPQRIQTDIKSKDFISMMPKDVAIIIKASELKIILPLVNIISWDNTLITYAISVDAEGDGAPTHSLGINIDEEYIYLGLTKF